MLMSRIMADAPTPPFGTRRTKISSQSSGTVMPMSQTVGLPSSKLAWHGI